MKIQYSKKAQTMPQEPTYAIYFMIAAALLAMGAIFLVVFTSSYQVETTSILGELESIVMEFRLLNSPECFVYQDLTTKRIFPHVIDLVKFTDERISECISPVSGICFKAELKSNNKIIKSVKSQNYQAPHDIKVSAWPVIIKGNGLEKSGFIIISTSRSC